MNPKTSRNDWLSAFLRWAAEPCPEGEWVYRGQAAEYSQVLPSGLRESNRPMFRSRLYDVDHDLAADIFQASPVFQESPLYPQIIDDQLGLQIQNMAYSMVGGPRLPIPGSATLKSSGPSRNTTATPLSSSTSP